MLRKKRKGYVDINQTHGKDSDNEKGKVTVNEENDKHKSASKSFQSSENTDSKDLVVSSKMANDGRQTESMTKRHQSQPMQASLTKSRDTLTDLKSDEIKCFESSSIFPESKKEQSYDKTHRKESTLIFPVDVDFYGSLSVDGGSEEVRTQFFLILSIKNVCSSILYYLYHLNLFTLIVNCQSYMFDNFSINLIELQMYRNAGIYNL